MYVGASLLPVSRVKTHRNDPKKDFDDCVFLPVIADDLSASETAWIATIRPAHNKRSNPKVDVKTNGWGGSSGSEQVRLSKPLMFRIRIVSASQDMTAPEWIEAKLAPIIAKELNQVSGRVEKLISEEEPE